MQRKVEQMIELRGVEKVAILMIALPEDATSGLLKSFDMKEIREISAAMIRLGRLDPSIIERVIADLLGELGSDSISGTIQEAERLLTKALPKKQADTILDEIRGPAGRTLWDKISNIDSSTLSNYLKNEHPQTIAVILSQIKHEQTSKILSHLPDALATDVLNKILNLEPVNKDVIAHIEKTLNSDFMAQLTKSKQQDSYGAMAEIFNFLDRSSEARLMANLEALNPEAAEKVKALMFAFEDLKKLSQNSLQALISKVDKSKLALALKGVDQEMRELFLKCMTERAGKLMSDEINQLGSVRLKDVEEAQKTIVTKAKELANEGIIMLGNNSGEGEDMVE